MSGGGTFCKLWLNVALDIAAAAFLLGCSSSNDGSPMMVADTGAPDVVGDASAGDATGDATSEADATSETGAGDDGGPDVVLPNCSSGEGGAGEAGPRGAGASDGGDASSAPTWRALYGAYFGPCGVASCGGSQCHGAIDSPGAGNWVCGSTAEECYQGMTTASPALVPPGGMADATQTWLFNAIRKSDAGQSLNNMPSGSNFVFQPADLALIGAWIQGGAPDN